MVVYKNHLHMKKFELKKKHKVTLDLLDLLVLKCATEIFKVGLQKSYKQKYFQIWK